MQIKHFLLIIAIYIVMISTLYGVDANTNLHVTPEEYQLNLYKAKVLEVKDISKYENDQNTVVQLVEVEIINKDLKGHITEIRNTLTGNKVYDLELKKNQRVSLHAENANDGSLTFYIIGYDRINNMLVLLTIFAVCILILGRIKGLKALISLTMIILYIIYILIPLLLKGYSPIVISIFVCTLATLTTFGITTGFNKKSISAIIGTMGGLIVGGIIAYIYGAIAKLTGFSSNDAQMLMYLPGGISFDFQGLLFAGIIIGALGASMDVSISISSALTEMQKENPNIEFKKLMKSGLNIGKDIMGTMVNTLVLAYTGATLSTLLVFIGFQKSAGEILNLDSVTTEIIRAMAGSIGLLFSIPITIIAFICISRECVKRRKNEK